MLWLVFSSGEFSMTSKNPICFRAGLLKITNAGREYKLKIWINTNELVTIKEGKLEKNTEELLAEGRAITDKLAEGGNYQYGLTCECGMPMVDLGTSWTCFKCKITIPVSAIQMKPTVSGMSK